MKNTSVKPDVTTSSIRRLLLFLAFGLPCHLGCHLNCHSVFSQESPPALSHAAKLVRQLGDEDYYVRQQAQEELIKLGIEAFDDISTALRDPDPEIAERAKLIFSHLENDSIRLDHPLIQEILKSISRETDPVQNVWRLRYFGSSDPFPKSEGLSTLCRFLRFNRDVAIRAEAAKAILISTPQGPLLRKRWFQGVKSAVGNPRDDVILRMVGAYAVAGLAVEKERDDMLESDGRDPGMRGETREAAREKVRRFAEQLAIFQATPEYDSLLPGSCSDILVHYTLAEFQQAVGLDDDCDKTVAAALAGEPQIPASADPFQVCDLYKFSAWAAHYEAGSHLLVFRNRLEWAQKEFDLALGHAGKTSLAGFIHILYSGICLLREDDAAAAEHLEKGIPIIDELEVKGIATEFFYNRPAYLKYVRARAARAAGKIDESHQLLAEALNHDPYLVDAVILLFQLHRDFPDADTGNGPGIPKPAVPKLIEALQEQLKNNLRNADWDTTPQYLNDWAMLAAGTDQADEMALRCAQAALKACPEKVEYLATLADVYAALGFLEKATDILETIVRRVPEVVVYRTALERMKEEGRGRK